MSTTTAVVASLGSAATFAGATVLQARSAETSSQAGGLRPAQVGAFVRATLSHPLYLAGMVAAAGGLALHAVALHAGSLALVQPLMITTVLFTLPLHHWVTGSRLSTAELAWALILTVGLAGFLLTAHSPDKPGLGAGDQAGRVDPEPAVLAVILAVGAAVACVVLTRQQPTPADESAGRGRSRSASSAALLGLAAGIAFAGTAALIKASTDVLARGPAALLTAAPFYALLVVGAVGLVLHQLALSAGPLTASLPAFTVIDPLVSVALGVAVYNESLRATPQALALELIFLVLLTAGAIGLTRVEADLGGGATATAAGLSVGTPRPPVAPALAAYEQHPSTRRGR